MKSIILAIVFGVLLIGGVFILSSGSSSTEGAHTVSHANNVMIESGKQIVTIDTKGGYQPKRSVAKAGMPTVIRFVTNGTFDCSSSVRIPSLGIAKILPQTGNTDIDIGTPAVATLQGLCVMGMYHFEIDFQR